MKVRQMSEVFLRGSLANETMKHLTKEQVERSGNLAKEISEAQILAGHRQEFIYRLSTTISCDYKDSEIARQEFLIAIWRAVVYLLYHKDYNFKCDACHHSTYISQSGNPTVINRRFPVCPRCKCCKITKRAGSKFKKGSFVEYEQLQEVSEVLRAKGKEPPTHTSCIRTIPGQSKVADPEALLNDPVQVVKYFGTWVWNYFRQILLENKRTYHDKVNHRIIGPAARVVADAISNILSQYGVEYYYAPDEDKDGVFKIACNFFYAPPVVVGRMAIALDGLNGHDTRNFSKRDRKYYAFNRKLKKIGIDVTWTRTGIEVRDTNKEIRCLEFDLSSAQEVQLVSNVIGTQNGGDDDTLDTIKQLEQRDMYPDQGVPAIDGHDVLVAVRDSLNDNAQKVFDLITGGVVSDGEGIYEEFAEQFPDSVRMNHGIPRQNKMAEFLCCSTKDIQRCRADIKAQMFAQGVQPI